MQDVLSTSKSLFENIFSEKLYLEEKKVWL
jgi:hypothetical protein